MLNVWVVLTVSLAKDDEENPLCFISQIQDITERKNREIELNIYKESLERLVDERTKSLTLAKNEAEKANRIKDDFLANISHELRTPLNSIIGLSSLMLHHDNLDEEQQDGLSIINKSSNTLLAIVNDILDISKIEADHLSLDKEVFNLYDAVEGTLASMKPLASSKGLRIMHSQ